MLDFWERVSKSLWVHVLRVSEGGRNGTNDTTEDTWHSVEVVDATRVGKVDLLLQEIGEPKVTTGRQNSCKEPNDDGDSSRDNEVRCCADSHTTSEGRVKDDFHIEALQGKTGNTAGCDAAGADGQEGVDDGSLLTGS